MYHIFKIKQFLAVYIQNNGGQSPPPPLGWAGYTEGTVPITCRFLSTPPASSIHRSSNDGVPSTISATAIIIYINSLPNDTCSLALKVKYDRRLYKKSTLPLRQPIGASLPTEEVFCKPINDKGFIGFVFRFFKIYINFISDFCTVRKPN